MTAKKSQPEPAEAQRFYKFVGNVGFSRLPRGPIDPDSYKRLPPELRHVVLHSGSWKPMTENEIEKYLGDQAKETGNAEVSN